MPQWVSNPVVLKTVKSLPHLSGINITHRGLLACTAPDEVHILGRGLPAIRTTINGYRSTSEEQ